MDGRLKFHAIFAILATILLTTGCMDGSEKKTDAVDENEERGAVEDTEKGNVGGEEGSSEGESGGETIPSWDSNETQQGGNGTNTTQTEDYSPWYGDYDNWDWIAQWDINDTSGSYTNLLEYPPLFYGAPGNISSWMAGLFNCTVVDSYYERETEENDIYHYNCSNGASINVVIIKGIFYAADYILYPNSTKAGKTNSTADMVDYANMMVNKTGLDLSEYKMGHRRVNEVAGSFQVSVDWDTIFNFNDRMTIEMDWCNVHFRFCGDSGDMDDFCICQPVVSFDNITPYVSIRTGRDIAIDHTNSTENVSFMGLELVDNHICYEYRTWYLGDDYQGSKDAVWVDVQNGKIHRYIFFEDY